MTSEAAQNHTILFRQKMLLLVPSTVFFEEYGKRILVPQYSFDVLPPNPVREPSAGAVFVFLSPAEKVYAQI